MALWQVLSDTVKSRQTCNKLISSFKIRLDGDSTIRKLGLEKSGLVPSLVFMLFSTTNLDRFLGMDFISPYSI